MQSFVDDRRNQAREENWLESIRLQYTFRSDPDFCFACTNTVIVIMEAVQKLPPHQQQAFMKELEKMQLKDSLS